MSSRTTGRLGNMASMLAKLVLAWHAFLHFIKIFKYSFRRKGAGAETFLEYYREDHLLPLSMVDKDWLLQFSRCVNCGICDVACPALLRSPREKFPGPSYLVTTLTRSTPDLWASELDFSFCQDCRSCQQVCPNLVPVKEAFEFIEAKKQILAFSTLPSGK